MDEAKNRRHHAKIINTFAPEAIERCLASADSNQAMREQVEHMCYKANDDYYHVMRMAEARNDSALARIFHDTEYTTSPVSRAASSHSVVFDRPDPNFVGPHSTPGTMSDPGRITAQRPSPSSDMGIISRLCSNGTLESHVCSIWSSNTQQNFIRAEVLERFSDKPFGEVCDLLIVPHLVGIGRAQSNRRILLTWQLDGHAKTHQGYFYVLENEMDVDILTADRAVRVQQQGQAPIITQPSPQRHFANGLNAFQAGSYHESSDYSRHSSPRSQPDPPSLYTNNPMGSPGLFSAASATPRASSINDARLTDRTVPTPSSAIQPKLQHSHLDCDQMTFLDMNDRTGTKYLQFVTKFYYNATGKQRKLDRSLHNLHITHIMNDNTRGKTHICSIQEDTFVDFWKEALKFISRCMPTSREFQVTIEEDDDG